MTRISEDEEGLRFAEVAALRSTCFRRSVGAVLVDVNGHLISTGRNGVATGVPHCNERVLRPASAFGDTGLAARQVTWPNACPGANLPSGTGLDLCEAIHAEQNALIQCTRPLEIMTCYVTINPCMHCLKMLLNTSCRRIVYRDPYPSSIKECRDLWERAGKARGATHQWLHLPKGY